MDSRFFHLRFVDIDHYDLCGSCPCFIVVADLTDTYSCTDCQQKIGVLHGKVSCSVAHISAPAAVKRIVVLDDVNAVPVGHNGNSEELRCLFKCFRTARKTDSAACIDNGTFGFSDFFKNDFNGLVADLRRKISVVLGRIISSETVGFDITALIVYRNIYPYGTGSARNGKVPRFFKHISYVVYILKHGGIFAHTGDRFGDIKLLIADRSEGQTVCETLGIACRCRIFYLTADNKHRDRIEPTADNARYCVRAAGSCCNAQGGNFIVKSCIGFCGDCACLLVVIVGTADLFVVSERIVEVHSSAADNREAVGYTV